MPIRDSERPLTSVISEVISDVAFLLQTEIRLAKAEIAENVSRVGSASSVLGAGAAILFGGFLVLLFAIVRWLAVAGIPDHWGMLIVGAIAALIGIALVMAGINRLKTSKLMPDKAISQMQADYAVIKDKAK